MIMTCSNGLSPGKDGVVYEDNKKAWYRHNTCILDIQNTILASYTRKFVDVFAVGNQMNEFNHLFSSTSDLFIYLFTCVLQIIV